MVPVRILFYAINGSGLGHLTRLLAIARSARDLLSAMEIKSDLRFLTTSEATGSVWDFPCYKLPSHTVVSQAGVDRRRFLVDSRLLAINLVASLSPQVLVTDTVPQGAFGEMSILTGHVGACVYIDRHKDLSLSEAEVHRSHLPLYERILVPDDEDQAARYPLSGELAGRRRFVGAVHGFRVEKAISREAVRDYFAVTSGRRLLYVGAGGGGDRASRAGLSHLITALAQDPRNHLLVGYGPLHQGDCIYRPNVTPVQEMEVSRFFAGVDAAVSAAGYNSYQELLAAGVPTLFYAQPKGMDRQDERIRLGLAQGWHSSLTADGSPRELTEFDPVHLRAQMEPLLEGEVRGSILEALRARPPAQGALLAATEILALQAARAGSPVQRGALYETALLRRAAGLGGEDFVAAVRAWRAWGRAVLLPAALADRQDESRVAWRTASPGGLQRAADEFAWGKCLAALSEPARLARAWCQAGDCEQERQSRHRLRETLDCLADRYGSEAVDEVLTSLREKHNGDGSEWVRAVRALAVEVEAG